LTAAAGIAKATHNGRLAIWAAIYRARAELGEKSADEVYADAIAAAEDAKKIGLPAQRVVALLVAARAKLPTDPKSASVLAGEALVLRDQLGSVEEDEAEIFLVAAQSLIAVGRQNEARAVLTRGKKILEAVALGIGDADWRKRFLEDVAANRALLAMADAA